MNQHKKDLYLQTCASLIKHKICGLYSDSDTELLAIMLSEGFRKFHNIAISNKGNGKYLGHKYWSIGAWDLFHLNDKKIDLEFKRKIRHEHVIPLNHLIHEILFKLDADKPISQIKDEIKKYSIVAIILQSEDKEVNKKSKNKMPTNWEEGDIFARYKEAYIEGVCLFEKIIDIETGKRVCEDAQFDYH